jgi:plasmid stabilization system protein ParE
VTTYRVVVTAGAERDLQGAHDWYRQHNPEAATRWLATMRDAILSLSEFPEAHPLAPENDAFDMPIRQKVAGLSAPWRILFMVEGHTVTVLHVRHGRRDLWSGQD